MVEVWFDDYKKYFYGYNEERYAKIDAGDLTKQFDFKKRMNCKPFQYYLDHVATRMLELNPLLPKSKFSGNLRWSKSDLCFGMNEMKFNKVAILISCSDDPENPKEASNFVLTTQNEIRVNTYQQKCLDAVDLTFWACHKNGGNQGWIFNPNNGQIKVSNAEKCLTGNGEGKNLRLEACDAKNENQKWSWGIKNEN